jgi:superfamily II DNA or RNA helicase
MKLTRDEVEERENKNRRRVKAISKEEQIEAEKTGVNIKATTLEAAAIIRAVKDMLENYKKNCNLVTFSKNVSTCKVVTSNDDLKNELDGTSLYTVYAGVPDQDRKRIFDEIRVSTNCVLCQHSIVKEGIDITSFNSILFSRDMNVIGTQQALGRVVRAHPDDTKDLVADKILLNSSKGWRKYEAVVYIIVDDDDMQDFATYFTEFYKKLRDTGLTAEDIQFDDVVPALDGMDELEGNPDEPIERKAEINGVIMKDLAKAIDIAEMKIDDEKVIFEKVNAMSPRDRFTSMFKNV